MKDEKVAIFGGNSWMLPFLLRKKIRMTQDNLIFCVSNKLVNQDSKKDTSMVENIPETDNESVSQPEEKDHVLRAWS